MKNLLKTTRVAPAQFERQFGDRLVLMREVLSREECDNLIGHAEKLGFQRAEVDLRTTRSSDQPENAGNALRLDVRNNSRVVLDDQEFADDLFLRVKDAYPERKRVFGTNCLLHSFSKRVRFYKYEQGQRFRAHSDGAFLDTTNGTQLVYSTLMFLSTISQHSGGATQFASATIEDVQPQAGSAVAFYHKMVHSGAEIVDPHAVKYVMRLDMMYSEELD